MKDKNIAVLVPCFNEAMTIGQVVEGFRKTIPDASVYVYDNNSTDDTIVRAKAAGAIVRSESRQGKGNVVRRMFADIDADVYIMVDGDATYDPSKAQAIVDLVYSGVDIVNVAREGSDSNQYRPGHVWGNRLLTGIVSLLFGPRFRDMLSGYKGFSRRFVKSFPALSAGFEIETELTIHALHVGMPACEIVGRYSERPEGSVSKLDTFNDGFRILRMIGKLLKNERPLFLFNLIGFVALISGFAISIPVFIEYFRTGLVPRLPTALLSTGIVIVGFIMFIIAQILDSISAFRRESKRMAYLSHSANIRERENE